MSEGLTITLIAAVARNGVIGRDGGMPWRLPADLAFFKRTTMGHVLVMGRKTFESAGALPGRRSLVLTRDAYWRPAGDGAGVEVQGSLAAALERARELGETEVFVCGGEGVFREALAVGDRLLITRVEESFEGDTRFPDFDPARWRRVSRDAHEADERNPYSYALETYERR